MAYNQLMSRTVGDDYTIEMVESLPLRLPILGHFQSGRWLERNL